jgi:hypothetical protein
MYEKTSGNTNPAVDCQGKCRAIVLDPDLQTAAAPPLARRRRIGHDESTSPFLTPQMQQACGGGGPQTQSLVDFSFLAIDTLRKNGYEWSYLSGVVLRFPEVVL